MELNLYRYIDGEKVSIQIVNNTLRLYDYYNDFSLEIILGGTRHLVNALKNIKCFSNNQRQVYLGQIIRTKFCYPKCWSNSFVASRAKPILDLLTDASSLEIDKDKLDKMNISNLKYIESKLPNGIKKVDDKILVSLFSID